MNRLNNRVIPVHKSSGVTTYDCIRMFKGRFPIRKVGHAGTLDPQATGLILLLTGEATKLSNYLMDLPKRYTADIVIGEATDTQDASGAVVRTGDWSGITEEHVRSVLPGFVGMRTQVPPMYSALKHKGTPLYMLARKGQHVEREPREIETYAIELVHCDLPVFRVDVHCSRGLYVRVLAEEIGEALGVPAHLKNLVRTQIGHFNLDTAVGDDDFETLTETGEPGYSLSEALGHLQAVTLTMSQAHELTFGIVPRVRDALPPRGSFVRLIKPDGGLAAIGEVGAARMLKIRRVFGAVG
jgi:tRNA pseudouridine55 synthase